MKRSPVRQQAGLKGADTKRRNLIAWARQVDIEYSFDMTIEEARLKGVFHLIELAEIKTQRNGYHDDTVYVDIDQLDQAGIDRATVNWLRHHRSAYDGTRLATHGKVGRLLAYPVIKNRILSLISEKFPELSPAAHLQLVPEEPASPAGPEE